MLRGGHASQRRQPPGVPARAVAGRAAAAAAGAGDGGAGVRIVGDAAADGRAAAGSAGILV